MIFQLDERQNLSQRAVLVSFMAEKSAINEANSKSEFYNPKSLNQYIKKYLNVL